MATEVERDGAVGPTRVDVAPLPALPSPAEPGQAPDYNEFQQLDLAPLPSRGATPLVRRLDGTLWEVDATGDVAAFAWRGPGFADELGSTVVGAGVVDGTLHELLAVFERNEDGKGIAIGLWVRSAPAEATPATTLSPDAPIAAAATSIDTTTVCFPEPIDPASIAGASLLAAGAPASAVLVANGSCLAVLHGASDRVARQLELAGLRTVRGTALRPAALRVAGMRPLQVAIDLAIGVIGVVGAPLGDGAYGYVHGSTISRVESDRETATPLEGVPAPATAARPCPDEACLWIHSGNGLYLVRGHDVVQGGTGEVVSDIFPTTGGRAVVATGNTGGYLSDNGRDTAYPISGMAQPQIVGVINGTADAIVRPSPTSREKWRVTPTGEQELLFADLNDLQWAALVDDTLSVLGDNTLHVRVGAGEFSVVLTDVAGAVGPGPDGELYLDRLGAIVVRERDGALVGAPPITAQGPALDGRFLVAPVTRADMIYASAVYPGGLSLFYGNVIVAMSRTTWDAARAEGGHDARRADRAHVRRLRSCRDDRAGVRAARRGPGRCAPRGAAARGRQPMALRRRDPAQGLR